MSDQNIWELIEKDPVKAASLNLRSKLMMVVVGRYRDKGWTKKELRKRLGATKAQAKCLHTGSIDQLPTDTLLGWVVKCGHRIDTSLDKSSNQPLIITVTKARRK